MGVLATKEVERAVAAGRSSPQGCFALLGL